jgi:hypothetical protein
MISPGSQVYRLIEKLLGVSSTNQPGAIPAWRYKPKHKHNSIHTSTDAEADFRQTMKVLGCL